MPDERGARLSLAICTMNRPDDLRQALETIASGSTLPFEVLVSDDAAREDVRGIASGFKWARYQIGPGMGLAANRNSCVRSSRGTHILFIDDDVRVSHEFLSVAQACAASALQRTIVTGTEMRHSANGRALVSPHNADWFGYQRRPSGGELRGIVINATIFPQALFTEALFDERLRYGYEEIDIARHAVSLGYRIAFEPDLVADHFPSPLNREQYQRHLTFGRLYSTMKAHLVYDRAYALSAAYAVSAPARHVLGTIAHGRPLRPELASIWLASQATLNEFRLHRQAVRREVSPSRRRQPEEV